MTDTSRRPVPRTENYNQSMLDHTQKLLYRARRIARLRAELAKEPHNQPRLAATIQHTEKKHPHFVEPTIEVDKVGKEKPQSLDLEIAIRKLSLSSSESSSKMASIKTPMDPQGPAKKKILNQHGLRLTLDDRRPTIG